MNDIQVLTNLVETLGIAALATAGNLDLIPLLRRKRGSSADTPNYLVYRQADHMGLITIAETSDTGTVAELRVTNRAGQPVLLVEGEVLLGMKQTRVLNITILVPAETDVMVPVSCVEAGRWRAVSASAVGTSDVHLAPSVRAAKTVTVGRSMRTARTFASDQGAVWEGVGRVLDGLGIESPSSSYADLESGDRSRFGMVANTVKPEPHQVGVIACIGGRVACVDVFGAPQVLAAMWEGLVTSYQAEAALDDRKPNHRRGAGRWFRSIAAGSAGVGPELGLGAHITIVAPGLEAAGLVYEGSVLHLSAFPAHQTATAPRFISPARRRS